MPLPLPLPSCIACVPRARPCVRGLLQEDVRTALAASAWETALSAARRHERDAYDQVEAAKLANMEVGWHRGPGYAHRRGWAHCVLLLVCCNFGCVGVLTFELACCPCCCCFVVLCACVCGAGRRVVYQARYDLQQAKSSFACLADQCEVLENDWSVEDLDLFLDTASTAAGTSSGGSAEAPAAAAAAGGSLPSHGTAAPPARAPAPVEPSSQGAGGAAGDVGGSDGGAAVGCSAPAWEGVAQGPAGDAPPPPDAAVGEHPPPSAAVLAQRARAHALQAKLEACRRQRDAALLAMEAVR